MIFPAPRPKTPTVKRFEDLWPLEETKMKVYMVGAVPLSLRTAKVYRTEEAATAALARIAADRRNAMGVHVYKDTPTEFSYIIGWEETSVTFKIAEIQVED